MVHIFQSLCHYQIRQYISIDMDIVVKIRHGYCSQDVIAVCDFNMRFTFVVAGWPRSAHDTRIRRDTLLNKYKERFPHPPVGTQPMVFWIFLISEFCLHLDFVVRRKVLSC
jgi:hypothetical protein